MATQGDVERAVELISQYRKIDLPPLSIFPVSSIMPETRADIPSAGEIAKAGRNADFLAILKPFAIRFVGLCKREKFSVIPG